MSACSWLSQDLVSEREWLLRVGEHNLFNDADGNLKIEQIIVYDDDEGRVLLVHIMRLLAVIILMAIIISFEVMFLKTHYMSIILCAWTCR